MSESPRIEELRRRVQGDPASIAFAALAEEFRRAGRFKEAVETSRAGLRHHPTYVSARVTLGRSLVELQEFEQAERELAFVLRSAPDNLAARRALGELCWQRLRFADALTHFKAALALAPRDAELPGVIASLERELESERAAAAPTPAVAVAAEASAEAAPAAAAAKQPSGAAAIAALEKFYRAIVRARDAKPPAAA
jgi:tetratricopeptide (TPR) repeat protein